MKMQPDCLTQMTALPEDAPVLPDSQEHVLPFETSFVIFPLRSNMEMESSIFFFFFQSLHSYLKITKLALTC